MNWTLERLKEAAGRRGASWSYPAGHVNDEYLELARGGRRLLVQRTRSPFLSAVALKVSTDKLLSGHLLAKAGLPVPERLPCSAVGPIERRFLRRHRVLAVKPNREDRGLGVTVGVSGPEALGRAVGRASRFRGPVILEPMLQGRDLRLLIIGGRFVGAYERIAPEVVGDGRRTVRGLVRRINAAPRRGRLEDGAELARVPADEAFFEALRGQGLNPASIPPEGRRVRVSGPANLARGAEAADRTEEVHQSLRAVAVAAAAALEVDVAGVDVICRDLSAPLRSPQDGVVLEVNSMPGVRGFLAPSGGRPRPVLDEFVDYLFERAGARRAP